MAGVNIGGSQSYTIPLDSVDMTYLSKYVRTPHAEKRPLWTRKCLDGESEYCHVQIVTQDDNEDCYSESTDTFKCHICDVQVPTMFYKEHTESEQHETIKNISQKILERVSKQINISIINNDKDVDKDVYYCVPCSKIIKIENKHRHESSVYHAKSKNYISLVSEFYKKFKENKSCNDENDFNEEKDEESDSETDNFKSYKANNNYDITNKNLCHILDSDDDYVDQLPITIPTVHQSTSNTGSNIQPINDQKTESFEEYLKEMIKKYNLKVNLPVINGGHISIVAPNGDTVKVSREHFQSHRQLKNSVYCQLCKMWISQDTNPHDVTEIHVRNILKPINEKFARMVDTVSSHCVPCNEIVLTNSNHHTLNDTHKKIIKDTHTPKTGKTLCEDCNIYIDTHNFTVHIKSKKHLNVIMQQNSVHKTENNNISFCKICNITVRNIDLISHVNSKTHVAKKSNDPTKINNINNGCTQNDNKNNGSTNINNKNNDSTKTNNNIENSTAVGIKTNDSEYCETCKVKVPIGGMKIHVDGKPHQKVVSQLCSENKNDIKPKENKVQSGAKPSTTTKKVSFASTYNFMSSIATNLSDDKIDAYNSLLEFADLTRTKVRCKICFVNIVYVERNIIEHIEGRIHVENANKKKMETFNKLLFYTDDAKTKIKCEICDVNIPYLERNIIEHMEGRNHEAAENELLTFHLVIRESSGYYCECCEEQTVDYLEHINSKDHTCKFLEKYEIDKNEMRKYVYDEDDINNCVARRHRERYRNLLRHNSIFKINDTNYYCGVCQIHLGRKNEIDHVLGDRHALNLEKL